VHRNVELDFQDEGMAQLLQRGNWNLIESIVFHDQDTSQNPVKISCYRRLRLDFENYQLSRILGLVVYGMVVDIPVMKYARAERVENDGRLMKNCKPMSP
jgi:hypothetical protein